MSQGWFGGWHAWQRAVAVALSVAALLAGAPRDASAVGLFGIDIDGTIYSVDGSTAELTTLGTTRLTETFGIARDPVTGRIWGSSGSSSDPSGILLYSFDPNLIALPLPSPGPLPIPIQIRTEIHLSTASGFVDSIARDLAFTASGALYAVGHSGGSKTGPRLYSVDRASGMAARIGPSARGGIAGRHDENLYSEIGTVTYTNLTGTPNVVSNGTFSNLPGGITHLTLASGDPNQLYALGACGQFCFPDSDLYRIDLLTNSVTLVGTTSVRLVGIAAPEPGSAVLLAAGLLGLAARRPARR